MPVSSSKADGRSQSAAQRDSSCLSEIEAVLFDLDGTLIDTLDAILASMKHATASVLGFSPPDEELMLNVGTPLIAQMAEFGDAHAAELVRVYREHNAGVHDELVREYPGVEESLERLREAGYRLGVVTSKGRGQSERGLQLFGLAQYFEVLVSYDDVPVHKPDPYPVVHAASLLGVSPTRCAYVGDSPHDTTAALSAGSVAIAALWGVATKERLLEAGPHYAVESMREVADLFLG